MGTMPENPREGSRGETAGRRKASKKQYPYSVSEMPPQNNKANTRKRGWERMALEESRGAIERVHFLCHLSL